MYDPTNQASSSTCQQLLLPPEAVKPDAGEEIRDPTITSSCVGTRSSGKPKLRTDVEPPNLDASKLAYKLKIREDIVTIVFACVYS